MSASRVISQPRKSVRRAQVEQGGCSPSSSNDAVSLAVGSRFPAGLLESSTEERVGYFRKKFIQHGRHKEVLQQVIRAIRYSSEAQIIWVYGPSGVGKTTLSRLLLRKLLEEAIAEMEVNPGTMPAILLELAPATLGRFDWVGVYEGLLRAANEPEALIEHKIDLSPAYAHSSQSVPSPLTLERGTPLRKLRYAIESCFRNRKVRVALLDEAHHLKQFAKGARSMLEQMDNIKSLANTTDATFVLIGTYELLPLTELSDQLCRRSTRVHFSRYRWDSAEDRMLFKNALGTFQMALPLREDPDLTSNLSYFYRGCLGCVGTLKQWLDRALAAALEDAEQKSFTKYLEQSILLDGDLLMIASRMREGEEFVASKENTLDELNVVLGLGSGDTNDRPTSANCSNAETVSSANGLLSVTNKPHLDLTSRQRQSRRVGERNPQRDKVGS